MHLKKFQVHYAFVYHKTMNIKYIEDLFEQCQIVHLQRKSDFFVYGLNSIAFSLRFFFLICFQNFS